MNDQAIQILKTLNDKVLAMEVLLQFVCGTLPQPQADLILKLLDQNQEKTLETIDERHAAAWLDGMKELEKFKKVLADIDPPTHVLH